jgi:hypothetical protein
MAHAGTLDAAGQIARARLNTWSLDRTNTHDSQVDPFDALIWRISI